MALVGAMRETSMLFALFIAFFVLRERFGLWRWVAVALMLAGMLLMRQWSMIPKSGYRF